MQDPDARRQRPPQVIEGRRIVQIHSQQPGAGQAEPFRAPRGGEHGQTARQQPARYAFPRVAAAEQGEHVRLSGTATGRGIRGGAGGWLRARW